MTPPGSEVAFSVIVPVLNSSGTLHELHSRLIGTMESIGGTFELLFVNDCSSDASWRELQRIAAEDPRVVALNLMTNAGQGSASLAGFSRARGAKLITLDDDLQHPPEEIPKLLRTLEQEDELDVVIGVPIMRQDPLLRRMGSSLINWINSMLLGKPLDLRFTAFRAMRREIADYLLELRVPHPALGPMILSVTRRVKNIPVRHEPRKRGSSGYSFRKILVMTLSNCIGYSVLPLHALAVLGTLGLMATTAAGAFFVYRYFWIGISVPGWMTLTLLSLTLASFNFMAFSVLGEYVLRISKVSSGNRQWLIRNSTDGLK